MIAEIVSQQKNIDEIARELVARAVEIDGNDNTTAQVIRVRSVEQVGCIAAGLTACPRRPRGFQLSSRKEFHGFNL
jgi:serine/threonine protein phosphatase PrpC